MSCVCNFYVIRSYGLGSSGVYNCQFICRPCLCITPQTTMFSRKVLGLVCCLALVLPAVATCQEGDECSLGQQLNITGFAYCLQGSRAGIDKKQLADQLNLSTMQGVKLLTYLGMYPGIRKMFLNSTIQQPSFEMWSIPFWKAERHVANQLLDWSKRSTSIYPGELWTAALDACKNHHTSQDPLCASIVLHNVLRALGRYSRYVDSKNTNYLPDWFQENDANWKGSWGKAIQSKMIPLRADLGGDKWGEWYHAFGIFSFGAHSILLYGDSIGNNFQLFSVKMNKMVSFSCVFFVCVDVLVPTSELSHACLFVCC